MSRHKVLRIYKELLKEGQKFSDFNFRSYAIRRTQDAFRQHKDEQDVAKINSFIKTAQENLVMVKRQVVVGDLYRAEKVLLENL